jgi:lipid II isoglutaminyl synthase (glutamine-hydrolysing)
MHTKSVILIGKTVKKLAALRGGGTALPGLVVEKLDPTFVGRMLADLPYGVVVISGTNGKTTTTKIVSELLSAAGLKVFTNKTGSNFVRGIAAAIVGEVGSNGHLPHDIAVLELDEAHAVQFIKHAPVRHALLLNVMRDQLDRFGEIDYTARLLEKVAAASSQTLVLNRDDPRVGPLAGTASASVAVSYFGADPTLHQVFVNDDKLHQAESEQPLPPANLQVASVELADYSEHNATFRIAGKEYSTELQLTGVYNFLNAAGALALCRAVLADKPNGEKALGKTIEQTDPAAIDHQLVQALSHIKPAFGRGETVRVGNQDVELVLVKNPAGFRLALASFDPSDTSVMIAINDLYADGRDMSWLWDVDFSSLQTGGVEAVTGIRAYDMALRLHYDNVTSRAVEPDLAAALDAFLHTDKSGKKRIFCTYTAMLKLRRLLRKYTKIGIME